MRLLTYFLLVFLSTGVSILATQNQQPVNIKFLNLESINFPLGLMLVVSAGLGTIVVTTLQISSRQTSRQSLEPERAGAQKSHNSNFSSPNSPKSRSQAVKDKIADFDDEFDDDWD